MREESGGSRAVVSTHNECPSCGLDVHPDEVFCEACGTRLASATTSNRAASEAATAGTPDHLELEGDGVAAVSDRGRRRTRNEDAVAVGGSSGCMIAVVCDGVASTSDAHLASGAAADAAVAVLEKLTAGSGRPGPELLLSAFGGALAAAQDAVAALPVRSSDTGDLSPSTTLVAAAAWPGHLVVASVGDSRAYWLPERDGGARLLTVDDSWCQEQIAAGADPERAHADPEAHTITRWIGVDAESADPSLTEVTATEPGFLVLCSDGLWNCFEGAHEMQRLVVGSDDPTARGIARHLVQQALEAGGHDNVSVAVFLVGPDRDGRSADGPGADEGEER